MIEKITPQIAALYIGQKCDLEWLITDRDDVFMKGEKWHDCTIVGAIITRLQAQHVAIVPHLRSLDSLTESEAQELYEIEQGKTWEYDFGTASSCLALYFQSKYDGATKVYVSKRLIGSPLVWLKLLEWGFDLFGLIPAGLAKEIPAQ